MTTHQHSRDEGNAIGARAEAATLFAAAVNHESANSATRLNCIAARVALQVSMVPSPPGSEHVSPDALITRALGVLGSLPADQFADPRVRSACRYGRRALRGDSR
jgi:hypothetical protein